jgi:hypothetical protein
MVKVDPYHTATAEKRPGHRDVYHDRSECPDGSRIEKVNWRSGGAGHPKCDWCKARLVAPSR